MSLDLKPDRCFVIAEAGTGHADWDFAKRFDKARALVYAAALAGADAVKFQWFQTLIEPDMFCWIKGDELRQHRWAASQMGLERWAQIKEFAEACGLVFLASAFQDVTVQWLIDLNLPATKVASRAAMTFPYAKEGLPRPFLISDGMMGEKTIWTPETSVEAEDVVFLQCEAQYPSTTAWKGAGGLSDHSGLPFLGIDAISRGCQLLEVHFMVKELNAGPDLPACLTVEDLKLICNARDYYHDRNCAA